MKKTTPNFDSRRGMSLAEVAVSLAIIMLVTGATVSLVISYSNAENRFADTALAVNTAENAVECFRFASSEDEFYEALLLTDKDYEKVEKGLYVLEKSRYTVTLTVDYFVGAVRISALDKDGREIYSLYYERE